MSEARPLDVWILDPANLTPYYCLTLCRALTERGDRVRFVTTRFIHDPHLSTPAGVGIDYHYFRAPSWLQSPPLLRRAYRVAVYPCEHWRFLRKACRGRPDVVHIQWSRLPWLDGRLVRRLRRAGIPVVHTVHDVEPLFAKAGLSALERVYADCDGLIVHTRANREQLLGRYGSLQPQRVHVIPHGPLQADECPPEASRERAREALGLPDDAAVVLYFGTIKHYKGLDLLLDAFVEVARSCPEAYLLVAGHPTSPADVPDLTAVRTLGPRFQAELDFIPNQDVWKYYLASDVVVLPYRNITQSGVLLSALAYARAAIVTDVGGLPEIIEPGRTGWVVPPESSPALASALAEALSDLPRTRQMGEEAKRFVESELGWDLIAEKTHSLYCSLLA